MRSGAKRIRSRVDGANAILQCEMMKGMPTGKVGIHVAANSRNWTPGVSRKR